MTYSLWLRPNSAAMAKTEPRLASTPEKIPAMIAAKFFFSTSICRYRGIARLTVGRRQQITQILRAFVITLIVHMKYSQKKDHQQDGDQKRIQYRQFPFFLRGKSDLVGRRLITIPTVAEFTISLSMFFLLPFSVQKEVCDFSGYDHHDKSGNHGNHHKGRRKVFSWLQEVISPTPAGITSAA